MFRQDTNKATNSERQRRLAGNAAQSANRIARWTVYDEQDTPVMSQTLDLVTDSPSLAWPRRLRRGANAAERPQHVERGDVSLGRDLVQFGRRNRRRAASLRRSPSESSVIRAVLSCRRWPTPQGREVSGADQLLVMTANLIPISNLKFSSHSIGGNDTTAGRLQNLCPSVRSG